MHEPDGDTTDLFFERSNLNILYRSFYINAFKNVYGSALQIGKKKLQQFMRVPNLLISLVFIMLDILT